MKVNDIRKFFAPSVIKSGGSPGTSTQLNVVEISPKSTQRGRKSKREKEADSEDDFVPSKVSQKNEGSKKKNGKEKDSSDSPSKSDKSSGEKSRRKNKEKDPPVPDKEEKIKGKGEKLKKSKSKDSLTKEEKKDSKKKSESPVKKRDSKKVPEQIDLLESDEDEVKFVKPKSSKSRKAVIIDSDSEEEIVTKKSVKKREKTPIQEKTKTPTKEKNKTPIKEKEAKPITDRENKKEEKKLNGNSNSKTKSTPEKKNVKEKKKEESDEEEFNPKAKAKSKSVKRKIEIEPLNESQKKKKKIVQTPDNSFNDSNKSDKTPDDKKLAQRANYFKFMARGKPRNLGSKEIPVGAPDCLANLTFVISGVLDSIERDEAADIVKKYGGRVTGSISKKSSYLLIGEEAGESKLKKARDLGIPQINEDEFFEIIRKSNPDGNITEQTMMLFDDEEEEANVKPTVTPKSSPRKTKAERVKSSPVKGKVENPKSSPAKGKVESPKSSPAKANIQLDSVRSPRKAKVKPTEPSPVKVKTEVPEKVRKLKENIKEERIKKLTREETKPAVASAVEMNLEPQQLWVDKYKPTAMNKIVGQAGESSNAGKLHKWLRNWFSIHKSASDIAKASWPGQRDPEGRTFKCALLSGPPGVGKTTTAHLVCKELGYDYYELNASDTRNKKGLHEMVADSLKNKTINGKSVNSKDGNFRKHVLIMDEVDGMSGNEDRGGIQELIDLIKTSRIPLICICNDRNHQKIRTLSNYCFDLRFSKPRFEQLKGFITTVCYREKVKLSPEAIQKLVISTDQDIRQILHQLQMYKDIVNTPGIASADKDTRLGFWDVCKKVFNAADHAKMSIKDKMDLFFYDYSFGPLFVQENYLRSTPAAAQCDPLKTLMALSKAAEALATGDLVERKIRSSNNWGLLPTQAVFSSYLPGEAMVGNYMSGIQFPLWLGKNSNTNKRSRLIHTIHGHTHLVTSGSVEALNLDYVPYLRRAIANPLAKGEINEAAQTMQEYFLQREDLDSIFELSGWPGMRDPMEKVETKTKSAFTRLVNKEVLPYSVVKITKGRGRGGGGVEDFENEDDQEEENPEEDEKVENDAMVKMKKKTASKGKSRKADDDDDEPKEKKAKASSSKGGRGSRKK